MAKSKDRLSPAGYDDVLGQIDRGVEDAKADLRKRTRLLNTLEKEGPPQPRRAAMYYSSLERDITHEDVLPFVSMLKRIGKVENLDLIVHSPGGDGLAAEKIIDLCRKYCTGKLRIVVPLYAKSAAALMALGGDEIVMGEISELGPIDAQVCIVQDGSPQQVSADHFLRAEAEAMKLLRSSDAEENETGRIYLASLSPAFLQSCKDSQEFGREFARRELRAHMFAAEYATDPATWDARIDRIVENLTASSKHLSHGRMITAQGIQSDADLRHLKVTALSDTDPYWIALYELLLRTDVVAKAQERGKVLFARGFQLSAG